MATQTQARTSTQGDKAKGISPACSDIHVPNFLVCAPSPEPDPNDLNSPNDNNSSYISSRESWRGPGELEDRWREKRELGVKPEKFKEEHPRTTHFMVEFRRYLQLDKDIYLTESNMMDLFFSCINHPWADQRSLKIEDDYFKKRENDNGRV
jgi:hypothetical protein